MKSITNYSPKLLIFLSLLIGQLGCNQGPMSVPSLGQSQNIDATDTVAIINAQPSNDSQVNNTFQATASANCTEKNCSITGWYIYIDEAPVYNSSGATLNANIDVSKYQNGSHCLVYRAWDNFGAYGSQGSAGTGGNCSYYINVQNGTGQITITSPTSNQQIQGAVNVIAKSTIPGTTQMQVWDNNVKLNWYPGTSVNANFNLSPGPHTTTVLADDINGKEIGHSVVSYTVTQGNGTTYTHLEQVAPDFMCDIGSCAGGNGDGNPKHEQQYSYLNQTSPVLSGDSVSEWFNFTGQGYYDALWAYKEHPANQSTATNLQTDFYSYFDSSIQYVQATEFDLFQSVSGYKYMIGGQCNIASGWWDVWDQGGGRGWIDLNGSNGVKVPCPRWSPGTWHHINIYATMDHNAHTYHYVSVTIDGQNYPINLTYGASSDDKWDDLVGVQWQLDINNVGSHETTVNEWLDSATFSVW